MEDAFGEATELLTVRLSELLPSCWIAVLTLAMQPQSAVR